MVHKHNCRIVVEYFAPITRETVKSFVQKVTPYLGAATKLIILIDSRGGSVVLASRLAKLISKLEGEVETYNVGLCASSAVMLFAAGSRRFVGAASSFCVHEVSLAKQYGSPNTKSMIRRSEVDFWNQEIANQLAKCTGRKAVDWKMDMASAREFGSQDAIEMGLAQKGYYRHRKTDIVVQVDECGRGSW